MPYKDPEKKREAAARYRKKNHDKILEKQRIFSKENPNYQKEQYEQHHDTWNENKREKYANDEEYREKSLDTHRKSREKNGEQWNENKREKYANDEQYRQNILEQGKKWRENNSEWISEYNKEYSKKNKIIIQEYMTEYGKKWYQLNKMKVKIQKKIYHKNNPDITLKAQIKYLEKNAIPFKITAKDYKRALMAWKRIIKNRDKVCQICGSDENLEAHHIIYRANFPLLSFSEDNGILLCNSCHNETHGNNLTE
jgi:5-methylcytosine-specific restriction endonuclease McrA